MEQKILLSYVQFMSKPVPVKKNQDSFANYLHSTVCSGHMCYCEQYQLLLSHYGGCHSADCHVCGPIRQLSVLPKFDKGKRLNLRDYHGPSSGSSEVMQPPPKHFMMKNQFLHCPFENGTSPVLAQSLVQYCDPGRHSNLQQCSEAPARMNAKVSKWNMDHFIKPTQDPTLNITDNASDEIFKLNSETFPFLCGDLIVGNKLQEIELEKAFEITDNIYNSERSSSRNVPHKRGDLGDIVSECAEGLRKKRKGEKDAQESNEKGIQSGNVEMKDVRMNREEVPIMPESDQKGQKLKTILLLLNLMTRKE